MYECFLICYAIGVESCFLYYCIRYQNKIVRSDILNKFNVVLSTVYMIEQKQFVISLIFSKKNQSLKKL